MIVAVVDRPADGAGFVNAPKPAADCVANASRIRDLNDRLRRTFVGGRIVVTAGVQTLTGMGLAELVRRVRAFEDFDAGNDPYGEHDFGRITFDDANYYFKIDYYDATFNDGSPDPADETLTRRVMTIMREDEY